MGKQKTRHPGNTSVKGKIKQTKKGTTLQKHEQQKKLGVQILTVLYLLIVFFTYVKVYQYIYDEKIDLGGDNANYYILGEALAEGHGFKSINMHNPPPHNHFPPGYPAIIAVVMKIFSDEITTIKTANGILFFFTLIILFFFFRKLNINIHLSFVLCMLTMLNYIMLKHSTIMMSEISFMLFSTITIFLFIHLDFSVNPLRNKYFYLFLLCLSFAYYIRSIGLALLGGVLLYLIIRKNWKYLISTFTGFVLLALPWYIRGKITGGSSYIRQLFMKNPYRPELGSMELTDWFTRIVNNLERYITKEIPHGIFSFISVDYKTEPNISNWIAGIIILLVAAYGLYKIPKYRTILLWYLLGTFGIVLLWPDVWFGPRYIIPILPFILLLVVTGIYEGILFIAGKLGGENQFVLNVLIPLCFLFSIPLFTPEIKNLHNTAEGVYAGNYRNFFDIAKWVRYNTPQDVVICCRKPALFYSYAYRPMVTYSNTTDKEKLIKDLYNNDVTYVVLEQLGYASTGRYLVPAVQRYPEKFRVIQHLKDPDTYLLQFNYQLGYLGEWQENQKHGQGKYTWDDGRIYEGEWQNDMRSGRGTFIWPNGDRFEGEWRNNQRQGKGTLYFSNGNRLEAEWKDDRLNGPGILYDKDGNVVRRSFWRDDQQIR